MRVVPGVRGGKDYEVWELEDLMATFFAVFYVDAAYLAPKDAEFLEWVGFETKMSKMQTIMICTRGHIRTQLPTDSYQLL